MCAKARFLEFIHDFIVFDAGTSRSEDLPAASDDRLLDEIYEHPLMGVADVNGLYPIADIQDFSAGENLTHPALAC